MPIVGGLDIHRKQLTFDYLDTVTGEVRRGQVAPADREHLRAWLARFGGGQDTDFALEGCTGWRYVAEELAAAGIGAHVGERRTPRRRVAANGTPRPTGPIPGICGDRHETVTLGRPPAGTPRMTSLFGAPGSNWK